MTYHYNAWCRLYYYVNFLWDQGVITDVTKDTMIKDLRILQDISMNAEEAVEENE